MKVNNNYSTWIEIDLSAIQKNVRLISNRVGVNLMAVVKADAYGHGMIPVAQAALQGGANWLGVARIEEAITLHEANLGSSILVLGYCPSGKFTSAIEQDISLTLWNHKQLRMISSRAKELGKEAKVHLKVDTGMSRLGVEPSEAFNLAEEIVISKNVSFEGIFTHFARADEIDGSATENQSRLFIEVLNSLNKADITPPLVHAANSAASISMTNSTFNMVRPGIAIYGLEPSKEWHLPEDFQPALVWKSVLSQVKTLPAGRGVSYGHEYVTRGSERIGTVPIGYADGFRRTKGNQVLIGGRCVPAIGRVCMDQVCVQLDEVPEAKEGDEVVIIGSQGEANITAENVAETWGTINYEVVSSLSSRVPRIYK